MPRILDKYVPDMFHVTPEIPGASVVEAEVDHRLSGSELPVHEFRDCGEFPARVLALCVLLELVRNRIESTNR